MISKDPVSVSSGKIMMDHVFGHQTKDSDSLGLKGQAFIVSRYLGDFCYTHADMNIPVRVRPHFQISFPFRSPQNTELSSLCHTVGSQ